MTTRTKPRLAHSLASGTEKGEGKMSWKPEVLADSSGVWSGNAIRLETMEEALEYVKDLKRRWTLVTDTRVVECSDEVSHRWKDGKLTPVDW